jgi:hypothetical protein
MSFDQLPEEAVRRFMAEGELPTEIIGVAVRVAVVLTQSWCPQWAFVRDYLQRPDGLGPAGDGLAAFFLEYDRMPYFPDFLIFKENTLGNDQVPYIRYYREARLVAESNFVTRDSFLAAFEQNGRPAG